MEQQETPEVISDELMQKIQELPPYMLESIKNRLDEIPVPVLEALVSHKPLKRGVLLKYNLPFSRHQMREIAMECIYQHLLMGTDVRACLAKAMRGRNEVDSFLYSLAVGTQEHEKEYEERISSMLRSDWSYDRLSKLEQAILLMSFQDIEVNETPKPVVIDEAVQLARQYCDDQSYKLINGILDRL